MIPDFGGSDFGSPLQNKRAKKDIFDTLCRMGFRLFSQLALPALIKLLFQNRIEKNKQKMLI